MTSPVRICLVGAGRAGKVHANSIVNFIPSTHLAAIVEAASETRQRVGDNYEIDPGARFDSLEAALQSATFDAVVITTPTYTHADLAMMSAQAGKHIFLEKPMALSLTECDVIIQATRQAGVLLQLGFMRRFDPEFSVAASRIEAGEIGQPMIVKSLTHGPGLPPAWARDLNLSNGMLAEVNSHDWDCIRWLMGSNYERIYTEIANFKGFANQVESPNFYDNALVTIKFKNGGLGSISGVCPCGYGYDARVEIIGEKGILQIGQLQGQAVVVCTNRNQGLITPIYRTWPERFAWAYIHEMRHFVDCIRTGSIPKASGEDGRWAVAGVLAATKSFLEQRPVNMIEILNPNITGR
jgi:predicted dehydrogenase